MAGRKEPTDTNDDKKPRRVVNVDDPKYKVLLEMIGREHLTNYLLTAPVDSFEGSGSQARPARQLKSRVKKNEMVDKYTPTITKPTGAMPRNESVPTGLTASASSTITTETKKSKYESPLKAANPKYQYVLDLIEKRKQLTDQLSAVGKKSGDASPSKGSVTSKVKSDVSSDVSMSSVQFGSEPFEIVEPEHVFDEDTIEVVPSTFEPNVAATEADNFELIDATNVEEFSSLTENFTIIDPSDAELENDEDEYVIP